METFVRLKTSNDKIIWISGGDNEGVSVRIHDKDDKCPNEQRSTTGHSQHGDRLVSNFNEGTPTLHRDLRLHDTVQVTATTDTGKLIILEVLPPETELGGMPCAKRHCNAQRLSDDNFRESLGLVLRYRDELKISVKIGADKIIALDVPAFKTVSYVKRMIQEKEGIPMHIQRLIFTRNVLHDQLSLNELNIGNGSQLVLSRITQGDMAIFVSTTAGNVFKLRATPCDTIDTLKRKIQSISGFSPRNQRLVFAGKNLTGTRLVSDYGIQTESTLQLFLHPQDDIQVLVKRLGGQTLTLKMLPADTVAHMKAMVAKETGVPNELMCLIFVGRQLVVDERILRDIGIGNNTSVHMTLRLGPGTRESAGYLLDERTLDDYNICKEHALNLIIGFKSCSMQIDTTINEMVKLMSESHRHPDENIGSVKSRILDNEDMILPHKQHVNILDRERTRLSMYHFDLTKEYSVHLVLSLREGMQIRVKTNIDGPMKLEHSNWTPGPRFNLKISSYQYRKSHCGDKTVVKSSYLHNGISYTGKMTSLYWTRLQEPPLLNS